MEFSIPQDIAVPVPGRFINLAQWLASGSRRQPMARYANPLAAVDIDLVVAARITARIENCNLGQGIELHDGRRRPLLQPTENRTALLFCGGVVGIFPQKGSDETLARAAGEDFPLKIYLVVVGARCLQPGSPSSTSRYRVLRLSSNLLDFASCGRPKQGRKI